MALPLLSGIVRRNVLKCKNQGYYSLVFDIHNDSSLRQSRQNAALDRIISGIRTAKISSRDISHLISEVITESQYKKFREAPGPALTFGLAGLIPFAAVPLLTMMNGTVVDGLIFTQVAYGATILSFLGGSNWGTAVAENATTTSRLGWAVTPQLIGWTALLVPVPAGIILTSAGLAAAVTHDVLLTNLPQWHKALRFVLTAGALGSLGLTFILNIVL